MQNKVNIKDKTTRYTKSEILAWVKENNAERIELNSNLVNQLQKFDFACWTPKLGVQCWNGDDDVPAIVKAAGVDVIDKDLFIINGNYSEASYKLGKKIVRFVSHANCYDNTFSITVY